MAYPGILDVIATVTDDELEQVVRETSAQVPWQKLAADDNVSRTRPGACAAA